MLSEYFRFAYRSAGEYQVWSHLGWRDLRVRFSRTRLGPWWSTLAQSVLVIGIATATSLIAQENFREHLLRVSVSLLVWTFIANVILESIDVFSLERGLLLNTRINELSFSYRIVWRQVLLSLYSFPIPVVCAVVSSTFSPRLFLLPIFVALTGAALVTPSFLVGYITLRRRDFVQIIPPLVQFGFFFSPVMWQVPTSGRLAALSTFNPLAWTMEGVRDLVLGDHVFGRNLALWVIFVFASIMFLPSLAPIAKQVRVRI